MVGLVVPVEDLDCMGDSGWPCVFGNGGACLVVVVGVVGMLWSALSCLWTILCSLLKPYHNILLKDRLENYTWEEGEENEKMATNWTRVSNLQIYS